MSAQRAAGQHGRPARFPVKVDAGRVNVSPPRPSRGRQQYSLTFHTPDCQFIVSGSEGGAQSWAILAPIVNIARLYDLDPQGYLTDVLERIASGRTMNYPLHELLVWNWRGSPRFRQHRINVCDKLIRLMPRHLELTR